MAAPATTTRQTPSGIMLDDGYISKLAFARDPDVSLWEIEVKPSGMDNGEPINLTTMHTVRYRRKGPRALLEHTNLTMKCGYDPICRGQIEDNLIGQEGSITQTWSDGSKEDFYGYLKSAEFSANTESEMPTVDIEIVVTNWDPVNRVEVGPNRTLVSGT
jgi:hypothetical protein